jgi:hypothetical protein
MIPYYFNKIPNELYQIFLQPYVSSLEYYYLISTSKEIFADLKFTTRQITLNGDHLKLFFIDPVFQAKIYSKIRNPAHQLNFNLVKEVKDNLFHRDVLNYLVCNKIHKLYYSLTNCPAIIEACHLNFAFLSSIRELELYHMSYPALPSFSTLSLSNTITLVLRRVLVVVLPFIPTLKEVTIDTCSLLTDFSTISHVEKCTMSNMKMENLDCFKKIPFLTFCYCPTLRDVTPLYNNFSLTFNNCLNVENLAYLTNCSSLQVLTQEGDTHQAVRDDAQLFNLPRIKKLTIDSPSKSVKKLTSFSSFLQSLTLSRSDCLKKLPLLLLQQLRFLSLSHCSEVESLVFPDNSQLKVLELSHLSSLTKITWKESSKKKMTISNQTNSLRSATINCCHQLTDFSFLRRAPKVEIIQCNGFGDPLEAFGDNLVEISVSHLILKLCEYLKHFPVLPSLKQLELHRCDGIKSFENMKTIPSLTIHDCCCLKDWSLCENQLLRVFKKFNSLELDELKQRLDASHRYRYQGSLFQEQQEELNRFRYNRFGEEPGQDEIFVFCKV